MLTAVAYLWFYLFVGYLWVASVRRLCVALGDDPRVAGVKWGEDEYLILFWPVMTVLLPLSMVSIVVGMVIIRLATGKWEL